MSYVCDELIKNEFDYNEEDILHCEKCGYECNEEDMVYFDDMLLCESCSDNYTFICAKCGKRHWNDNSYSCGDDMLCEHCYDYHFTSCSECGRVMHNDDCHYLDSDDYSESPLCESCYEDKKGNYINDYYYKPEPIFYRSYGHSDKCYFYDGLHFGIELEIAGAGEDDDNARKLLDIANESAEHIYIKHDGSITEGFEIVSHPCTLAYHQNNLPWNKVFTKALHMGYKSHEATCSCGLHVHVGRSAFGNTYQEQEDVIARILYFVERFWDDMLLISRRDENALARWAARYEAKENPKATLKHAKDSYSRYRCLNLQNVATIEFRLFRGTLKYSTFIATLQLVDKICSAAISLSDENFQTMTWADFCSDIVETEMPELVKYLKSKSIYQIEAEKESA